MKPRSKGSADDTEGFRPVFLRDDITYIRLRHTQVRRTKTFHEAA